MIDKTKRGEIEFRKLGEIFSRFDTYIHEHDLKNARILFSRINKLSHEFLEFKDPHLILLVKKYVIDCENKLKSLENKSELIISKRKNSIINKLKITKSIDNINDTIKNSIKNNFYLKNNKIKEKLQDVKSHPHTHVLKKISKPVMLFSILIILMAGFLFYNPGIVGFLTAEKSFEYNENLNYIANENQNYTWFPERTIDINSLKISGKISESTKAKVYVRNNYQNYLIFDTDNLETPIGVTGFVVLDQNESENLNNSNDLTNNTSNSNDNETLKNETNYENNSNINTTTTKNNTLINETENSKIEENKDILINLEYGNDPLYDSQNIGITTKQGIIDLTVENTIFSEQYGDDKLCTRWETYSLDDDSGTMVCYGSQTCCNFVEMAPTRTSWDEPFYSNFGRFGATENNEILAQVIYANYQLTELGSFSNIKFSEWAKKDVRFFDPIAIEKSCIESCSLSGFNASNYEIIVEVSGGVIILDNITYTSPIKTNVTEKIFTNFSIKDSRGYEFNTTIELFDINNKITKFSDKEIKKLEKGQHKVKVNFNDNKKIKNIELSDLSVYSDISEFVKIDYVKKQKASEYSLNQEEKFEVGGTNLPGEFETVFAIDPSPVNFTSGLVTVTATSNTLYKCKNWNFTQQKCFGSWVKLQKIVPGENYTIFLTPDDPGFGEINITDAVHLNATYSFISDIFEEVELKDNIWSEPINQSHFVRVIYDQELNNGNVIDVYVRNPTLLNCSFNIYHVNTSSPVLGSSGQINADLGMWVYMTLENVVNSTDTFDFEIIGNESCYLEFDYIHDEASGDTSQTLAFWLSAEGIFASDKGIDNSDFDESPISLNDYGDATEKCEYWNCSEWTEHTGADIGAYCEQWNCTIFNGITCNTWNCDSWKFSNTADDLVLCRSGWNCNDWNGDFCRTWNCSTWTQAGDSQNDFFPGNNVSCINFTSGECDHWNFTFWEVGSTNRRDFYCNGTWGCSHYTSDVCDTWNCSSWDFGSSNKQDVYCSGSYFCEGWTNGRCDEWNCTSRAQGGNSIDIYCDEGWNCTLWNLTTSACGNWTCLGWAVAATDQRDVYCSGIYNCTVWKEFSFSPDGEIKFTSLDTGGTLRPETNFSGNVTIEDAAHGLNYSWWGTNSTGTWVNQSLVPLNNVTIFRLNSTANITVGKGNKVCWQAYANDTEGNFSNSSLECFTVGNYIPAIDSVIINTTFGFNESGGNLTANVTTIDPDGDKIKVIYDWRINGTSYMILNMPFENISNTSATKDYSIPNYNGTISGPDFNMSGYDGFGAMEFDSSQTDFIDLHNIPALYLPNNYTMMVWIYLESYGENGKGRIVNHGSSSGDGYIWYLNDDEVSGGMSMIHNDESFFRADTNQNVIGLNKWQHVAVSYDGNSISLFVDGIDVTKTKAPIDPIIPNSNENIRIGDTSQALDRSFDGKMDELFIFNVSLSAAQIRAYYENMTNVIVSDQTRVNDSWQVCVTPNDNQSEGGTVCSNNITIIEDKTPPSLVLHTENNSVDIDGLVNFQINVSDNESNIDFCQILINNSVRLTTGTVAENIIVDLPTLGLLTGDHEWQINCSSEGGFNESEVRIINILPAINESTFNTSAAFDVDADNTAPWERGNATDHATNGCYDDNSCWGTNINGNYTSSGPYDDNLTLTDYVNLSGYKSAVMFFYHFRKFEDVNTEWDGGVIDINYSDSWERLTPLDNYTGNFTDSSVIAIYHELGYAMHGSKWEISIINLTPYVGNDSVKVKFRFAADTGANDAGWYIDYFRLSGQRDLPPYWNQNGSNNTEPIEDDDIQFYVNWTDETGLSSYIFSWNDTGVWDNNSNGSLGDLLSLNVTINKTLTANGPSVVCWRMYVNDTINQWNETDQYCFDVDVGDLAPTNSSPTNSSPFFRKHENFTANITIDDDIALNYTWFGTNATGTWSNYSTQAMNGLTTFRFNNSQNITVVQSNVVCWQVYINDSLGNLAESDLHCFTVSDTPGANNSPINSSPNFRKHENFTANITINDVDLLNFTWIGSNASGSWSNETTIALNGLLTYRLNTTTNISIVHNETICWRVYFNDSIGNLTESDEYCFVVQDTPGANNSAINSSSEFRKHENFTANITVNDVDLLNWTWFGTNNSGDWVNDTPIALDGVLTYSFNNSKNISLVNNEVICWRVYFNDSTGNFTESDEYCFIVQDTPGQNNSAINSSPNFRKHENFTANITVNDVDELNYTWFSTNNSGSWVNDTPIALDGVTTFSFNNSKNLTKEQGNVVCWRVYWNDTQGNLSESEEYCFTIQDTPTDFANAENSSPEFRKHENFTANITISDSDGLNYTWFGTNATGTWSNYSTQEMNGLTTFRFNNSQNITVVQSNEVCWIVYANDSIGNLSESELFCFTVRDTPGANNSAINSSPNFKFEENFTANITIEDIDELNFTWFATNNSGSWENDTAVALDGVLTYRFNNSKNISQGNPNVVCWRVYWNDTKGNISESEEYCFSVANTQATIQTLTDDPDPQGYGLNVTVEANITDPDSGISNVIVEIVTPDGTSTNYTMTATTGDLYAYNYSDYTNGTYDYKVYVNESDNIFNSSIQNFTIFVNLSIQIRTMKDVYGVNEFVNLTDPPNSTPMELDMSQAVEDLSHYYNYNSENEKIDIKNQNSIEYQYINYSLLGDENESLTTFSGFIKRDDINITYANYLDKNYEFIQNIFKKVKAKDNKWSNRIFKYEFIRVEYEIPLINGNVIDVFVRNPTIRNCNFEIYETGTNSPVLGKSNLIKSEKGEWVYTTVRNLKHPTDSFDIKIIGDDYCYLEFDYIHDAAPVISSLTINTTKGANESDGNITANVTFSDGDGDDVEIIYTWYKNGNATTVLYAPFALQPNASNVTDYTNWSAHGLVYNGTINGSGGFNGFAALEFNATNDTVVEFPEIAAHNISQNLTILFWIKSHNTNHIQYIIEKGTSDVDNYGMNLNRGRLLFEYEDDEGVYHFYFSNLFKTHVRNDSTWTHVGLTVNETTLMRWYINGTNTENDTPDSGSGLVPHPGPIHLGKQYGAITPFYLNGTLDELMIFNYVLTPQQIANIYNNGTYRIVSQELKENDTWWVCATANDNGTNSEEVCSNNITIKDDTTPPSLLLVTGNNSFDIDGLVNLQINVSDDDSGITSCAIIINDTIRVTSGPVPENTVVSLPRIGLFTGEHEWQVNCSSDGGHNLSEKRIIRIDNGAINESTFNTTGAFDVDADNTAPWNRGNVSDFTVGGCFDDASCWATNINGGYTGPGPYDDNLTLSDYVNLSGYKEVIMFFYHFRKFESASNEWDGGVVDINYSDEWERLTPFEGYTGNFTDNSAVAIYHELGYAKHGSVWELASFNLTPYIGNETVKVKLRFAADSNTNDDGWHFDYFRIAGTKDVAPIWNNNGTNNSAVIENDNVSFYVNWTDETGLSTYIFSWNDSGVWDNNSNGSLSDLLSLNVTINKTITASSPNVVCWRMYVNDTANQFNETDQYCFNVSSGDSAPTFDSPINSSPNFRKHENFTANITLEDDTALNYTWYGTNNSGSWVNNSPIALNGVIIYNFNNSNNISLVNNEVICWQVYVNDSNGIEVNSSMNCFTIQDTPGANNSPINNSPNFRKHENFTANITIEDIDTLNYTWFGTNATGSWVNGSTVALNGVTTYRFNSTENVTENYNSTVCWTVYFNDSQGNLSESDLYCFTIENTPPIIDSLILNATDFPTNSTYANLSIYPQDISDVDDNEVTIAYNWKRNDTSILLFYYPWDIFLNSSDNFNYTHDFSGFDSHVTIKNLSTLNLTGGIIGGAAEFFGDDRVSMNSMTQFDINNDSIKTILFWIKPRDMQSLGTIMEKNDGTLNEDDGWRVALQNGTLIFRANNLTDGVTSWESDSNLIKNDTWNFVGITINRLTQNLSFFVNGEYNISFNLTEEGGEWANGNNLRFGESKGPHSGLNATLDEIQIYNLSLTQKQIEAIYNGGVPNYNITVFWDTQATEDWGCTAYPIDEFGLNGSGVDCNTLTLEDLAPRWSNNGTNDTSIMTNDNVSFYVNWSDDLELSSYIFSHNISGTWNNDTNDTISGTEFNVTVYKNVTTSYPNVVCWRIFVNDSGNQFNETDQFCFDMADTEASFVSPINSSPNFRKHENFTANITINDIDELNYTWFSTNESGVWVNDSIVALNGVTTYRFNNTKNITSVQGNTICWQIFVNDTQGNLDNSSKFCFIIQDTPTDFNSAENSSPNFKFEENFTANITINDLDELNYTWFSTNNTGIWVNDTAIALNGVITYRFNNTKNISSRSSNITCWKVFANDTAGNISSSDEFCFHVQSDGPTYSSLINGSPNFRQSQNFTANGTIDDTIELNYTWFSTNATGTWINETAIALNGVTTYRFNNSKVIDLAFSNVICWTVYANNSDGDETGSGESCFTVIANASEPSWFDNSTNATAEVKKHLTVWFSVNLTDELALNYSIFSYDNGTGEFVNETPLPLNGSLSTIVNRTLNITSIIGTTFKWKFYFNDSEGEYNVSAEGSFLVISDIIHDKFEDNCQTSDLSLVNETSADVNDLVFDDCVYVKLEYHDPISLNTTFNIDNVLNTSFNLINLNGTHPELNTSANITFRGLVMGYPTILKDGVECSDCTILAWNPNLGEVTFNISSFSNYTATEANQSKIQNNGTTNASFRIYLSVQFFNGTDFVNDTVVHNSSLEYLINTTAIDGAIIKLDNLFNQIYNTSANTSNGDGKYRVYVTLLDPDGNVLENVDGSNLTAFHNFTIDLTAPTVTILEPENNTYPQTNNITFNWTVTDNLALNLTCNLTIDSVVNVSFINHPNGTNVSQQVLGFINGTTYYWNVTCWDQADNKHTSDTFNFTINLTSGADVEAPTFDSPTNSSPNFRRYENFTANITINDDQALDSIIFSTNNTGTWVNDTPQSLGSVTTFRFNNTKNISLWRNNTICWKVYANDTSGNENVSLEHCFIVQNTAPLQPVLSSPTNNSEIEDRQPFFNWTASYDPDNDTIYYRIEIVQLSCSDPYECQFVTINTTVINQTNFTPTSTILDVDSVYNWSVIANDSIDLSTRSDSFNFTINSLLAIKFNNSLVNFSSLGLGQTDNTTDGNPLPFQIENDGNIHANITVKANSSIWIRQPLNTSFFQFSVDNFTEVPSFDWSESQTTIANFSNLSQSIVKMLNWSNATDTFELEVFVEVPIDEPHGSKTTNITVEAS